MTVTSKNFCSLEIIYSMFLSMKDHCTDEKVYVDNVLQTRGEDGNPYPCLSPYKRVAITWSESLYYVIENGYGYVITVMEDPRPMRHK